jgi:hypothetical protein
MGMSPRDQDKQLKILKYLCSSTSMTVNIDKMKVVIIKSKKITCANFVYDNNNLKEVTLYKYLRIDLHHKLNYNYSIEKKINKGWKYYYKLENNCKFVDLWLWEKKKLITPIILYGCEVWGCSISRELWRKSKSKSVL